MTLGELFTKYGSDKETLHGYARAYEGHFDYRRDRVRAVLEIGVKEGASLRAWKDYFPHAEVVGIEVCPVSLFADRVTVLIGDQNRPWDLLHILQTAGREYDLIVDDGSHQPLHQIGCFLALRRLLRPGGVYMIEDVQNERLWNAFPELFPGQGVELKDCRWPDKAPDSLLVTAVGPR